MKRIFAVLFSLLFSGLCLCQPAKELDSLLNKIDFKKEDSILVRNLHLVGKHYIDNNPSKALGYFEQAVALAVKLDNTKLQLGDLYGDLGLVYLRRNDFDKALDYYLQSAKIFESINDNHRLADAYMSVGKVFFWNKSFAKSTEYYDKAAQIAEEQRDSQQVSQLFSQRAMIHAEQGSFDTALYYFQRSADITKQIGDSVTLLGTLSNIGLTYLMRNEPLTALQYFNTVLESYDTTRNTLLNYAAIYDNIGAAESKAGHYAAASVAFDKSNGYAVRDNIPYIIMENYRNMSDMYADMKNYQLQNVYLEKYYHLKDSVFGVDNKNQLTQLEADYQLEKKNISLANEEAKEARTRSQRNTFIIIAIAAAFLAGMLVIFYSRIRQKNSLLNQQNEQISRQKDDLQSLNEVKDRLFSVIGHDLRNPLVTLKTYLSLPHDGSIPEEKLSRYKMQTQQALNQTADMLDNLLEWANTQIKNTKPVITVINLEDCIDDAISAVKFQANQKGITISKNMHVPTAPADHRMLEIVLRNLLTNAVKYSHPGCTVDISTATRDQHIILIVSDEGIGMSRQQIDQLLHNSSGSSRGTGDEKGSGLGLFLVREFLGKMNMQLEIQSVEGKGSQFIIEFT
ncbi:MAG TPA: tetratricopeptide repeat-containing sensor histidine kinase [Saprospiraceae bacterium]|nr:tetratricopeptide repeat-containing sensor histidine kinase [Saprospiraceae bacterium]